ncbi:MAG: hypothetical protein GY874_22175, partial [Desulfobacteraceae bacterium]|nr:hypothetical protein [Desulfobacteraceae bacterium]
LLIYKNSPHALVELRKEFKEAGLRKQEREITYAIKRSGFKNAMFKGNLLEKIGAIIKEALFGITCKWGMSPLRPIFILTVLIFLFSYFYTRALYTEKKDGIWKVWVKDRVRKDLGQENPELLKLRGFKALKTAFYFCILSAFHTGWRDLNVGSWIARIQPHEYMLRASGRVRIISGIQSLISVYLCSHYQF